MRGAQMSSGSDLRKAGTSPEPSTTASNRTATKGIVTLHSFVCMARIRDAIDPARSSHRLAREVDCKDRKCNQSASREKSVIMDVKRWIT
jgi:hypothetical protein